jgi:hypothetical protein
MDFLRNIQEKLPEGLTTDKAIELLLAAIAYEHHALGNIIDAEAQKINHAVLLKEKGLLTLDEVRAINDSAFKVLKAVLKIEMLLEFELEDLVDFIPKSSTSSTTTTTSTSTTTTTTTAWTPTTTSQTSASSTTTEGKSKWTRILKSTVLLISLASKRR